MMYIKQSLTRITHPKQQLIRTLNRTMITHIISYHLNHHNNLQKRMVYASYYRFALFSNAIASKCVVCALLATMMSEPRLLNLYYKLALLINQQSTPISSICFSFIFYWQRQHSNCLFNFRQVHTIIFSLIMKYTFPLLFLVAILTLACCELDPSRLRVVDSDQKRRNFLVRGNLPISRDKKFQMKELKRELAELTGLDEFQLVVISFLNFLTAKQTKNRYIEEKYFERHPQEGKLSSKLILGSMLDPFTYHPLVATAINVASCFVDLDDIEGFITDLYAQIHERGRRKIVFIHCSRGMDRTGLVAGAYKMKYLNYEMKQVLEQNSHFGGQRKFMLSHALNGLKWYCLSLKGSQERCQTQ